MARFWLAKRNGSCAICKGRIVEGKDSLGWLGDPSNYATRKVAHEGCIQAEGQAAKAVAQKVSAPAREPMSRAQFESTRTLLRGADEDVFSVVVEEHKPVRPTFTPSPQQETIRTLIGTTRNSIAAEAGPGTAKTTTACWAIDFFAPGRKAMLAFASDIAKEFAERLPADVHASTTHSLGLSNTREVFPEIAVDDKGNKPWDYAREIMPAPDRDVDPAGYVKAQATHGMMVKLLAQVMNSLTDPADTQAVADLAEYYGIAIQFDPDMQEVEDGEAEQLEQKAIAVLPELYAKVTGDTTKATFDDMLYWSATGQVPCEQFDTLVVDESQDFNTCQIEFIMRTLAPGGRALVIGDPKQAIFGFRGANAEAMRILRERLGAVETPLSISYRLPLSGVELANSVYPDSVLPKPGAIQGEVYHVGESELVRHVRRLMQSGGKIMGVCRVNRPLAGMAYELIAAGIPASVRGRDIGEGLVKLAEKVMAPNLAAMRLKLEGYKQREVARLTRQKRLTQAAGVADRVETLEVIMDQCQSPRQVQWKVRELFDGRKPGVVLSTVHKAKGSEAEHVLGIYPHLVPFSKATRDHEIVAERNLQFVWYSRHKQTFTYVEQEKKRKEEW